MSHNVGVPQPIVETLQILGQIIKIARKEAGFTMTELATRAKIERKTLARLEKGESGVSLGVLVTIVWLLDIPIFNGLNIGQRNSRTQLSLLLNSFGQQQAQRIRRSSKDFDDNF